MIADPEERGPLAFPPPVWLVLAVALPAILGAICGVVWLLAAAAGFPRAADGRTLTLPEAAAIASHADVARLLRSGVDPNAPSRVRAGLVGNRERMMTPLEAATASIRTGPLRLLVEAGATIDDDNYPVLWCSAMARHNQDMIRLLESRHSRQSPIDCAAVRTLW